MLTIVLVVLAALVVGVLAYASTKPDTFRVERTARIEAPPEQIHAHIDDFQRWAAWSPWEKLDPAMRRSQSGAPNGVGAVYEWEGNNKVGKGRMEIVDASPSWLSVKLDFLKPFEAHNVADFTLEPTGNATNVTWAMHGPRPFAMKVMSVFADMDNMVGRDFESGLASLKSIAERPVS